MYKYACLIILYNPEEKIIEQLKIYSKIFDKVYLFDNSEEKTDFLENTLDTCKYIKSNENVGISGALNFVINEAINNKYDYLLTMDQDTIFEEKYIKTMIEYIEKDTDDSIAIYATNFNKMYLGKKGIEYSKPKYSIEEISFTKFHITSGNFLKLSLVRNIMPLDNYFIAFVDFDMDYELHLKGYKIKVIGNCIISQQIGNPIKANIFSKYGMTNMGVNRFYYLIRNNLYFSKKYKKYMDARFFAFKKRILYFLKIILCEKNKIEKIKMSIRGYNDYKKGILGQLKYDK